MLRAFREFLQWRRGDCIVLAEANVLPETDMEYFGEDGDRMHMMFNFQVNAAIQRRHPDSLLNWTERIIRMRKEVPEIGWGDFAVIPTGDPAVLVMRYDWRNNSVLFVHNFGATPREVSFAAGAQGEHSGLLVSEEHSTAMFS